MICRKLFKGDPTSTYTVFRFPCGDKSSVQGFQFHVLKFFPFSKRIFEGFELVYNWTQNLFSGICDAIKSGNVLHKFSVINM